MRIILTSITVYDFNRKTGKFRNIIKNGETPENCLECGACEAACPQHLNIIESLKEAWGELNV